MMKFDFDQVTNSFKALFLLITEPKNCFNISEDGYLTSNGVGAFQFWAIFTFIAITISMFTSKTPDNYSFWFIGTQFAYSAIRMFFVIILWALVAELFLENRKHAVSIALFSTGFFSILLIIPVFYTAYDVGFESMINPDSNITDINGLKTFSLVFAVITGLYFTYTVGFISNVYKMSFIKSASFFLIITFAYNLIIRPLITEPLFDRLRDLLIIQPWLA